MSMKHFNTSYLTELILKQCSKLYQKFLYKTLIFFLTSLISKHNHKSFQLHMNSKYESYEPT